MEEKGQDWRELNGVALESPRAMHHWMDRARPRARQFSFCMPFFIQGRKELYVILVAQINSAWFTYYTAYMFAIRPNNLLNSLTILTNDKPQIADITVE